MSFRAGGDAAPTGLGPFPSPLSHTGATLYAIVGALVTAATLLWYIPRRRESRSQQSARDQGREDDSDSSEPSDK